MACAAKKFGAKVAFVGSVGEDIIGKSLKSFADKRGFDGCYIAENKKKNTTLAFVSIDSTGERSFCFFRKNTADAFIAQPPEKVLKNADIVHIGSLMLSEKRGVAFIERLAERARRHSAKISFDVNFRSDIFKDEREAVEIYKKILPLCAAISLTIYFFKVSFQAAASSETFCLISLYFSFALSFKVSAVDLLSVAELAAFCAFL